MVEVHKVSGAAFDGNVYLILDKRPILVDAGMMAAPTLRNIKKFIDPAKIEMIVLTHCHHDHSGAAPELKAVTGARLLLSEKEVGAVGDDLASVAYLFGQQAPAYQVDETLKEGMVLDTGEWKLEVMETPGHSTGSLCLYEPQAKVLFSGDTVFPDGNIGQDGHVRGQHSRSGGIHRAADWPGCGDHVPRAYGDHGAGCQAADTDEPEVCQEHALG